MLLPVIRANSTDICRFVPARANIPFDSHQFVTTYIEFFPIVRVIYFPLHHGLIYMHNFNCNHCIDLNIKQLLLELEPLHSCPPTYTVKYLGTIKLNECTNIF